MGMTISWLPSVKYPVKVPVPSSKVAVMLLIPLRDTGGSSSSG